MRQHSEVVTRVRRDDEEIGVHLSRILHEGVGGIVAFRRKIHRRKVARAQLFRHVAKEIAVRAIVRVMTGVRTAILRLRLRISHQGGRDETVGHLPELVESVKKRVRARSRCECCEHFHRAALSQPGLNRHGTADRQHGNE